MHRFFNVFCALLGLIILLPLFFCIAVLIIIHDGGKVLFRSERVGQMNRRFKLYKFRTMIPDASKKGAGITSANDNRITPIGKFLRRYKLDEFPQLINVVIGDMNLVGPRPEDPRYVALYSEEQRKILHFKPGMTSPASLQYSNEERLLTGDNFLDVYVNTILPRKIRLESEYFPHQTVAGDVSIILKTIFKIFGYYKK
jgi:lipopolysaccharide/colanic/teichoic acid biosynthesis glycosyltransferase